MKFGDIVLLLSCSEPGHSPGTRPDLWQEVIYELMSGFINLQGRHAGNLIDSSNLPRAGFPGLGIRSRGQEGSGGDGWGAPKEERRGTLTSETQKDYCVGSLAGVSASCFNRATGDFHSTEH